MKKFPNRSAKDPEYAKVFYVINDEVENIYSVEANVEYYMKNWKPLAELIAKRFWSARAPHILNHNWSIKITFYEHEDCSGTPIDEFKVRIKTKSKLETKQL